MTRRFQRRIAVTIVSIIALLGPSLSTADAVPGLSGKLTFRRQTVGTPATQSEIWMMNANGTDAMRVSCNTRSDIGPAWSPDGQTIAFYSDERLPDGITPIQNIYLIDVNEGCGPGTLLTEGRFPSWSPVGWRLAFDRGRLGVRDIWVRERDGTEVNLTNDPEARNTRADWSPDGRKIVFSRGPENAGDIYVMNADGSEMTQLTFDPADDNAPQWSLDGRKILFQSARDGNLEIYLMNPDGTDQTRLTFYDGTDASPRWSPDGMHIVFHRQVAAGINQLFIMNPDGTGLRPVTVIDLTTSNAFPDWGHGPVVPQGPSPTPNP